MPTTTTMRGVQTMNENADGRRVITGMRHGGHAIVDKAPGADRAVEHGSVRLSEITQDAEIAKTDGIAGALVLAGVSDFDYLFPALANDPAKLLPAETPQIAETTVAALNALGTAMIEQAPPSGPDAPIPPVHTYWGQFVDHDLTAATDNDSVIGIDVTPLTPMPPADVVSLLVNKRNPALNLDSLYGDGPFATPVPGGIAVPYRADDPAKFALGTLAVTGGVAGVLVPPVNDDERDLPRQDRVALIGDGRNDENLVVAQLHVAFLRFHNNAVDWVRANEPGHAGTGAVFARARDLTRWAYQWLTVHDYLDTVLDAGAVDRAIAGEDDPLGLLGRERTYMPLEFSVAAFRFGHSMVRGAYDWNRNFGFPGSFQERATLQQLFQFTGTGGFLGGATTLPDNWPIEWQRFVELDDLFPIRAARPIDTFLASPLQEMVNQLDGTSVPPDSDLGTLLVHLARRNLLRGFRLGIPTGQAIATALGITPLTVAELTDGLDPAIRAALESGGLVDRTPLWFYVLRESEVRNGGAALGPVGSRIVAETIVGQLRKDPRSYLNRDGWTPDDGVLLPDGGAVTSIAAFLRFAGVL
ncbi:heme peroxidase family protein [Pseudonocardia sp. NPDC046786]|uniref:peroxidase family protein n=1 Tax=Pseudonocardia sp. NPDC046786 TaxID=3155471 RepID=UPI0034053799